MRHVTLTGLAAMGIAAMGIAASAPCLAQSAANLGALRGLAPFARLLATPEGEAALAANLKVTGDIQSGAANQPMLLPLAEQRRLALKDCFITDGNATQLADGLGTRLGGAYQAKATYADHKTFTSVSPAVARLIGYTNSITKSDSNAGKYFFANGTGDGKKPVSGEAASLLADGLTQDVLGKAYGRPAGTPGSDAFGDARPFQTLPALTAYRGEDYFGQPSHSLDWLRGPHQDLTNSPAFPSGHTTYGTTEAMILAILVPARYRQMVVRAAEYGNDRIVVGAHYAMDVIGGRTTSLHALAHLLANDPTYVAQIRTNPAVPEHAGAETATTDTATTVALSDYPAVVREARSEIAPFLGKTCGQDVAACAAQDTGRFRDPAANAAFIASTLTYGLPVVHKDRAGARVDVAALAPEAGHLLTAAFPEISLAEANHILSETLAPGGGFLDDGSEFGVYSRLDLYEAGGRAAALAASRQGSTPSR